MTPKQRYVSFLSELKDQLHTVEVDSKPTKELICVMFDYFFNTFDEETNLFLARTIQTPHLDDRIERDNLILQMKDQMVKILNDKHSRQAVITPKYIGDENRAACITSIHFLLRNNRMILNCYQRSQNIDNFMYDQQTLILLCKSAASICCYSECEVNIIVGSLHQYI